MPPLHAVTSSRAGPVGAVALNRPSQEVRAPRTRAFTIVEVMMASVILVVGFIGMISALTVGSEMLANARQSALAGQILNHEMEKLRLKSWTYLSSTLVDTTAAAYTSDLPAINTSIAASGVSYQLAVDVTDMTTDLREVTLTLTWTKSGTSNAAATATGSWLQRLAFSGNSPIARTYTRVNTSWFGKNGLNNSIQR